MLDDFQKKAVFFHPKLKRLNMFEDGQRLINEIRNEVKMINPGESDEEDYQPPPKRKRVSLESRIIDDFSNSNFSDQPLDEVEQYLNSFVIVAESGKIDLCKHWFDNQELYPSLYKLSLKYLCVPASSTTAETKFFFTRFERC